jgi:hypothetical protein
VIRIVGQFPLETGTKGNRVSALAICIKVQPCIVVSEYQVSIRLREGGLCLTFDTRRRLLIVLAKRQGLPCF